MKHPKILMYIFYRCTKKKKNHICKQKYIRLEDLEAQIDELLSRIEIPESFKNWAIEYLNELHDKESNDQIHISQSIEEAYQNCVNRINNLVKLKISSMNTDGSLLSDEEFQNQILPLKKSEMVCLSKRKI